MNKIKFTLFVAVMAALLSLGSLACASPGVSGTKATYDMSGVVFEDATYTYDGTEKTLVITGELPDGVTVSYTDNKLTEPGTLEVTASFTGNKKTHNAIPNKIATLTVEKADYDMSTVQFADGLFVYDGEEKTLEITGRLPDGVTVTYSNNKRTEAGSVEVTASFTGNSVTHKEIPDLKAYLRIAEPSEGLTYEETGKGYVVSGYTGRDREVFIPTVYEDIEVVGINDRVFADNTRIEIVCLPEKLKEIGEESFAGCTDLTGIKFPATLKDIGYKAFSRCSELKQVTIPASVKQIGYSAFSYCAKLEHFFVEEGNTAYSVANDCLIEQKYTVIAGGFNGEIPADAGITTIEKGAFAGKRGLISVNIPAGVTAICAEAFANCAALETVTLGDGLMYINEKAFYDCTGIEEIEFPAGVQTIGEKAFAGCEKLTTAALPSTLTALGAGAFSFTKITEAVIPTGLTEIGEETFSNCYRLASVTLHPDIAEIGAGAFYFCIGLSQIELPDTLTELADDLFAQCQNLTTVNMPQNLARIGDRTFASCVELELPALPASLTSIGEEAFKYNSFTTLTVPANVQTVGKKAFSDCSKLTTVNWNATECQNCSGTDYVFSGCENLVSAAVGEGVKRIPGNLFYGVNSLVSVTCADGLEEVGLAAFRGCVNLPGIELPDSVTVIGGGAFSDCTSLKDFDLPSGLQKIEPNNAFDNCFGLTSITLPAGLKSLDGGAFHNCYRLIEVYNLSDVYVSDKDGGAFLTDNVLDVYTDASAPSKLHKKGDYLFYVICDEIYLVGYDGDETEITLPADYEGEPYAIYNYAFYRSKVTKVTIPEGVIGIGKNAFANCNRLENISLPTSLKYVGARAFSGCYPDYHKEGNLYYLGNDTNPYVMLAKTASSYSTGTINQNTKIIGPDVFASNTDTASIVVPEGVTFIGDDAFDSCRASSVSLPDSLEYVGERALSGGRFSTYTYQNAKYLGNETNNYVALLAAENKNISSTSIHYNTRIIYHEAFRNCTYLASTLSFGSNLVSIGKLAFDNSKITGGLNFNNKLKYIGDSAFDSCSKLSSGVVIPDSVEYVGRKAFSYNYATSVSIGAGVKHIGREAFSGMPKAATLTVSAQNARYFSDNNCLIDRPNKTLVAGIKNSYIPNDGSVTRIGAGAFHGVSSLTGIGIPSSVEIIGEEAFESCSQLSSISIGAGVKVICKDAFAFVNFTGSVSFVRTDGWKMSSKTMPDMGVELESADLTFNNLTKDNYSKYWFRQ